MESDNQKPEQAASCPPRNHWGRWIWVLLIGAVVYLQWPMLKGWYYKATNAPDPESAIAWRSDYASALDDAGRAGRPVLLDFSASWCPPCKVMKHDVWPDAQVANVVNGGYVPVLVDVDDPKSADVAQRYGIRGIPAVLIVDAQGRVLKQGAFMSKRDMLEFLKPRA